MMVYVTHVCEPGRRVREYSGRTGRSVTTDRPDATAKGEHGYPVVPRREKGQTLNQFSVNVMLYVIHVYAYSKR